MLVSTYSFSSYDNGNSDLDYLIMMLDQVSGYDAIYSVDMTKELYDKLKLVPNDRFSDEKIIKEAKEMLEQAIEK